MSPAPVISCAHNFSKAVINWNEGEASTAAFNHSNIVTFYKVESGKEEEMICSLTIASSFSVTPSNTSGPVGLDLNMNSTYIILAQGPVKNGTIKYHSGGKTKSKNLVDMTLNNKFFQRNNTNHNDTEAEIYEDCFQSKGCFGYPEKCELEKTCDMIVTYAKDGEKFKFQIGGKSAAGYVALGLSDDKEMGDDSVMACIQDPTTNTINVSMYWNTASPYGSDELADPHFGLTDITGSLTDGFYT